MKERYWKRLFIGFPKMYLVSRMKLGLQEIYKKCNGDFMKKPCLAACCSEATLCIAIALPVACFFAWFGLL